MTPIRPSKRNRLFNAIVSAGCELVLLADQGVRAIASSREPDARADAAVERIDVLAWRIATLADTAGDPLTFTLAAQIRQQCQSYRVHDAAEDGLIGVAQTVCGRIVTIVRGLNVALERELRKRSPLRQAPAGEGE